MDVVWHEHVDVHPILTVFQREEANRQLMAAITVCLLNPHCTSYKSSGWLVQMSYWVRLWIALLVDIFNMCILFPVACSRSAACGKYCAHNKYKSLRLKLSSGLSSCFRAVASNMSSDIALRSKTEPKSSCWQLQLLSFLSSPHLLVRTHTYCWNTFLLPNLFLLIWNLFSNIQIQFCCQFIFNLFLPRTQH